MAAILNERNLLLRTSPTRVLGSGVVLTSGVATAFTVPANATSTLPGTIVLTAIPSKYVSPSYSWSRKFSNEGAFTVLAGETSNTLNAIGDTGFLTLAGTSGIVQYKVSVVETSSIGANPSDFTITIPILRQGASSILGVLTNDSQTVAADAFGNVPPSTLISSTLIIYNGTSDDSTNWNVNITSTSGVSARLVDRTIIVDTLLEDTGYVEVSATRSGFTTVIIKRFNVSKARAGTDAVDLDVQIESTNGTIFRVGQARTTTLIARVFKNGVDITDSLPTSKFKWLRVSLDPRPPPNDDATWNTLYSQGYKQILINVDDVSAKATFHCQILN